MILRPELAAAVFLLLIPAVPAVAGSVTVGPGGRYHALDDVPWRNLQPSDEVIVQSGLVQTRPVVIAARGSAAAPIRISAGNGARPVLHGSIVFEGAAHVIVERLAVEGARDSGVIIRRGSEDITVRNMLLRGNGLGLWIGDGAGGGHHVTDNDISENKTHGIGVDQIANEAGHETVFAGNTVSKNGHHGFEIDGSRFVIEDNVVFENGQTQWGISGIHLYAGGFRNSARHVGMGSNNIVRYNTVFHNLDSKSEDGNGIEADTWCNDNDIYYNVVYENDGAGIVVFDGARNRVVNNTLFGNERDPGRTHTYHGEFLLGGDYTQPINNSVGNIVKNNLLIARTPNTAAIVVDKFSALNNAGFGGNLLFNTSGGPLYVWGGVRGDDIARWNQLTHSLPADKAGDPLFRDVKNLPDGLRLRLESPAARLGQALGLRRDRAGTPLTGNNPPSAGAYEVTP
jgi:parallel beta-helix repeat protein